MDNVFIQALKLKGKHGVHDRERVSEQEFIVDISVEIDTTAAVASDNIRDTANYSDFAATAKDVVENQSFYLIESLADAIAKRVLGDQRIQSVMVKIVKPEALKNGMPGVTIIRRQK